MKRGFYHLLLKAWPLLMVGACANPGTPSGGPKDVEPPKVKQTEPAANSLNFKGKEISIKFDEIIQLKDVTQKLVVSPPVNKQPDVDERGNEVRVTFDEDLQPNTTYTLDFADAISDYNEGNVVENYRFSFSTGLVADSLAVSGNLYEANDLSPVKGALVFLHNNLADSAFRTLVPVRMAKTDEKGRFSIQNVAPGSYRLYALEDANRDYKYDQPGERIAWLDSLVVPSYEYRTVTDSITPDSTATRQVLAYTPDSLDLFMFGIPADDQYLVSDGRKEKACLNLIFKQTVKDFSITPLLPSAPVDWSIIESSAKHDTLNIWMTNQEMINTDSLAFKVDYQMLDSLKRPFIRQDTIIFYSFTLESKEKKKKKKDELVKIPSIKIGNLVTSLDMYNDQTFMLPAPAVEVNKDGIKLMSVVDSVKTAVDFTFIQDSLNTRRFIISRSWKPGEKYELVMDSASIRDVYGLVNKPFKESFSIKGLDTYGTIYLTLTNAPLNSLVQIVNSKEMTVRQSPLPKNGKLAFKLLKPSNYMIRIVVDNNNNGQWDNGDYNNKIQPETILYCPLNISLRANWEQEVEWDASTFNLHGFSLKFRTARQKTGAEGNR